MEYIELVIKIPKEMYNKTIAGIYEGEEMDCLIIDTFMCAIANGTLLPKGHGDLIDADELDECKEIMNTITGECKYAVRMDDIRNAPTIIEADKAESEDKE